MGDLRQDSMKIDCITNSVFNSRTYIISESDSNNVWLVDCGDVELLLEKIAGRQILGLFLTHTHFDHIYGLPEFMKLKPSVPIYTNEYGKMALADDKLNLSRYHERPISIVSDNVVVVREGDNVGPFSIIETPGHSPSSICILTDDFLFTGDSYIPGVRTVVNLPKCDKTQALLSWNRIEKIKNTRKIYPGH